MRIAQADLGRAAASWKAARRETQELAARLQAVSQGVAQTLEEVVTRASAAQTLARQLRTATQAEVAAAAVLQAAAEAQHRAQARKERVEHCMRVERRVQREREQERQRQERIASVSMW